IILQQPFDIVELTLRPRRIAQTAAQLFENPTHALHVDLAGDHPRQFVAIFAPAQRTPQGIGLTAIALPAADMLARTVTLPLALLHRFGEALGALTQRVQRASLRLHRAIGVAIAEVAAGIAHRAVGLAETVVAVVVALALVGLLVALALLAGLA